MSDSPFVTVVIPALNEEQVIADCLRALQGQTWPRDRYEVIVVDNGSADRTADIARSLGARVLYATERSAYVARNAAIAASTGDYLAFTDADCVPAACWIADLVAADARHVTGIVAGHIEYKMAFESLGNRMLIASRSGEVIRENVCVHHCAPTGNVLIRRDLLERHGPFSTTAFGSDVAFSRKLAACGHPPVYAPGAIVVHQCDLTSGEYLSRTYWNNRGNAVHAPEQPTTADLFRQLAQFPWRPGFRNVPAVQLAVADQPRTAFLTTWLYMCGARLAAYAGRVAGTAVRVIGRKPASAAAIAAPAASIVDAPARLL
ncbi:MAG: glycosyltransferase family 2 protein [Planctomycetaceae bacterium]|nr:glycosyltransferase family 2 protein [Planctomycetaceae bacterium]